MGIDELGDPNKERAGRYQNTSTGELIDIEGPELGLYRKVHRDGRIEPLGTTVSECDIKGLERIA
ncbi:MAG TPA: hypothetical protein VJ438_04265 [Candidatus Nanoarchaeia archaeon]|nr:hypothetical protein [Candidatus Nanoarchaeia archaeon]